MSATNEPNSPDAPTLGGGSARGKRRWIVLALAVVLVVGIAGTAFGLHRQGDAKADDYAKAITAWDAKRDGILAAPTTANTGLWDFEGSTEDKSVATQKTTCARVDEIRKTTKKDAASAPTASGGFKPLSASYRKATKDSAAREKAVNAYAVAADKMLAQLHKDCLFNIRFNSGDSGSQKYWDQAEKLSLKNGERVGSIVCESENGCIPATAGDRKKYGEAQLKANKIDRDFYSKLFDPGVCDSTSYGKVCDAMKAHWVTRWDNKVKFAEKAKSGGKVNPVNAANRKRLDVSEKKYKDALFALHPEFKADKRLTKNFSWTEAYFDASTRAALVKLQKLGAAIPK